MKTKIDNYTIPELKLFIDACNMIYKHNSSTSIRNARIYAEKKLEIDLINLVALF